MFAGCFFKLREEDPEYDDIYFWMPPTWTSLFFVAFNVGLGPISWCLVSDGFPLEIRTNAIACVVSLNWLLSLLAMLVFESALSNYGAQRTMWIFAACCWLGGALSVLFVKETHGRTLTEIQESFNGDIQGEIGELNVGQTRWGFRAGTRGPKGIRSPIWKSEARQKKAVRMSINGHAQQARRLNAIPDRSSLKCGGTFQTKMDVR